MKKVGSVLSSDLEIEYLGESGGDLAIDLTNLSNGVPSEMVRSYLLECLRGKADGRFNVIYKGAPKWVIRARVDALLERVTGDCS